MRHSQNGNQNPHFRVWSDASAVDVAGEERPVGLGLVFGVSTRNAICAMSERIVVHCDQKFASAVAEVSSLIMGLMLLPPGSDVVVHTDRDDISKFIEGKDRDTMLSPRNPISGLFKVLEENLDRHASLQVVFEGVPDPKKHKFFRAAHNLAIKASGGSRRNLHKLGDLQNMIDHLPDDHPLLHRAHP